MMSSKVTNLLSLLFTCAIVLLPSQLPMISAKDTYCRNRFASNQEWLYCTKFGTSTSARVRVKVKAKFLARHNGGPEVEVGIYRDQDFDQLMNGDKKSLSCKEKRDMALERVKLTVPSDSKWSETETIFFTNSHLPRIYYFVIMDCEQQTHMTYRMMPKIEVDFNIVNQPTDEEPVDHFSYEEQGTLGLHLTLLFSFTPLFGLAIYKCVKQQRTFEMNHSPFFIIILALFFQLGNLFWKVIHLLMYSSNGTGIPFFDIVSLICQMMSEITFSSMLMMIANGWTLSFNDLDIDNNLDIYLPLGSVVIVIHLTLAAMTYVDFDAHHKYHDYSGVQGWVLILFKLGLFAYYLYCVMSNKDKIPKRSQGFYRKFIILGAIYMMAVPFTILASYMFMPYNRQYVFTLTTNLVQLISNALMIYQQSSTQSNYFKASLNAQGILPTGKLA